MVAKIALLTRNLVSCGVGKVPMNTTQLKKCTKVNGQRTCYMEKKRGRKVAAAEALKVLAAKRFKEDLVMFLGLFQ